MPEEQVIEQTEQSIDQNQYLDGVGFEEQTTEVGNEPIQPQEPAPEVKEPEPIQPNTGETKPATPDFIQSMLNEDNSVNIDKYLNSLGKPAVNPKTDFNFNNLNQQQQQQEKPAEKSELEIRREYRQNLETESFTPFNKMRDLVNQGYTVEQAFQQAEYEANQGVNKKSEDWLMERQTNADNDRATRETERIEALQLEPMSRTNINRMSQEFGFKSAESFQNALFHAEYGGIDINFLFESENPNYKTEFAGNHEGLQEAYNNWFTKFSANENKLRYLANQTKFRSSAKLWGQAVKQIRGNVQTQEQAKTQANMASPNGNNLSPKTANPDDLTDWLSRDDKRIDNI